MATIVEATALERDSTTVEPRKIRPIVGWATLGGCIVAFEIYLLVRWPLSGDFVRQGTGPDPVPTAMQASFRFFEAAAVVTCVLGLYYFLIRPWRRAGHITSDGLMIVAIGILFWQDPLGDYVAPWSMYNSFGVNFGSWLSGVPGVAFPQAEKLAEPVYTIFGFVGGMFLTIVFGNFLMRKAQQRWPSLSNFRLVVCVFITYYFVDFAIEFSSVAAGVFVFPGAIEAASIFPNSRLKFPMYEPLLMSVAFTGFVCFRYFKNDKGETWVERGADRLNVQGWRKSLVRFLAMTAAFNAIFFLSYNVPINVIALNSNDFPTEITDKSYLMGGGVICGEGTTYHCPGPEVPIARQSSAHVAPDGQLVPAGAGPNASTTTTATSTTTATATTTTTTTTTTTVKAP